MACRKDGKGRVLRKGEHYRKTDGRYSYIYTDPLGKKRTIYAKSLVTLRQKEDELVRDQMDGLIYFYQDGVAKYYKGKLLIYMGSFYQGYFWKEKD